jgi:hypothetical protein
VAIFQIDVTHKRQTKANDCWYACIQMLLSTRAGGKTKPLGDMTREHRSIALFGRKICWSDDVGAQIMNEYGLVSVHNAVSRGSGAAEILKCLKSHGPVIITGAYGPFGVGHCVVLHGVDTDTDRIATEDPAWFMGASWKPLSYLDKMHVAVPASVALPAMA